MVGPPRGATAPVIRQHRLPTIPRAQLLAEAALLKLERFAHIEATSGIVLLLAAVVALVWANSSFSHTYHDLWHTQLGITLGSLAFTQSLHFWINDGLMTLFFLVVGMEIRSEIHEGALSTIKHAALPLAAAIGGVLVPALIYLGLNHDPVRQFGWAIPTATDIAFAVGVLALLGKSIPGNVRVFLLALAVIDDIIAVLVIAFFYSGGLEYAGFLVAGLGMLMILGLHRIGAGSAYAYILPSSIVWIGLLMTGAHPSLAGVVLGLMTPVLTLPMREQPIALLSRISQELAGGNSGSSKHQLAQPLKKLRLANREMLPPVARVQMALHPWVAYGVMPIFALANAGVTFDGVNLDAGSAELVMLGIVLALVCGKPIGVISVSWLMVRLGLCNLPPQVSWRGVCLVGALAGIGFTMSIFVAMMAFGDENLLATAKLGVLLGSVIAAVCGLIFGYFTFYRIQIR